MKKTIKEKIRKYISECISDELKRQEKQIIKLSNDLEKVQKEFMSISELKQDAKEAIEEIQTIMMSGYTFSKENTPSFFEGGIFSPNFISEVNDLEEMIDNRTHNKYDVIVPVIGSIWSGCVGSDYESCIEMYTNNKWLLIAAIRLNEVKGKGHYYIGIRGKRTPFYFYASEGDTYIVFPQKILCENNTKIRVCIDRYKTRKEKDIEYPYIKFSLLGAMFLLQ